MNHLAPILLALAEFALGFMFGFLVRSSLHPKPKEPEEIECLCGHLVNTHALGQHSCIYNTCPCLKFTPKRKGGKDPEVQELRRMAGITNEEK